MGRGGGTIRVTGLCADAESRDGVRMKYNCDGLNKRDTRLCF